MNQTQREFLIKRVRETYEKQTKKILLELPKEPSLNNYLVAAALDGSLKLRSSESMRESIRQKVLRLGHSDTFVDHKWSRNSDERKYEVTLEADILFVFPKSYVEARAEYERVREELEGRVKNLEDCMNTIILKIQIGSSVMLERLVNQVDNMADLSLVNNHLLLTDGK